MERLLERRVLENSVRAPRTGPPARMHARQITENVPRRNSEFREMPPILFDRCIRQLRNNCHNMEYSLPQ